MTNYNLSAQLAYVSLDLLDMVGESETLQKLEDIHEILRDATPDDRLLAVRNLANNLRLQVVRAIGTAYRAAPSEFPSELAALIAEHNSFTRAFVCYDGAPDESRCAEELRSKFENLRAADTESIHAICGEIRSFIAEHSEGAFSLLRSARRALEEIIIAKYFPYYLYGHTREEEYLMSLLMALDGHIESLYSIDFLWHENGTFFMIDGAYFCRQTDKERLTEVLRYLNRIAHYLPHEELECRITEWKLAILKHFADYATEHIAGTEPSKHMENCVRLLHDIAEQKGFQYLFPNDDRDNNFYELDALLGAGAVHCSGGIPEPMNSEHFWYDWGCVGGALSRCGDAYHEVIVERAAVALVSRILEHLLDNKKVDAMMQRVMHFYLALVLFGVHALDDNMTFEDVMKQIG